MPILTPERKKKIKAGAKKAGKAVYKWWRGSGKKRSGRSPNFDIMSMEPDIPDPFGYDEPPRKRKPAKAKPAKKKKSRTAPKPKKKSGGGKRPKIVIYT